MLQYALLHLFGYALTMDDLKAFRVSSSGLCGSIHHSGQEKSLKS